MTKLLVIEARYYNDINDMLLKGVYRVTKEYGAEVDVITVPGALEIPAALNMTLRGNHNYDAFIVLGCIIRGETSHYDVVCNESARGVYDLVQRHNLALGNGILTTEDMAQAEARADMARKDKGGHAAAAALRMLEIKRRI